VINQDVPEFGIQDFQKVGQTLVNILTNAVKFTHEGSIKVTVSKKKRHRREFVQVVVRDSGIGIQENFEIGKWFGNLEVVNSVNQHGIGFGLNISKRLIQRLGGQIKIKNNSEVDGIMTSRGITVTLEFPANYTND